MTNALTDRELEHLLNFIGYGRLDADIWFLGMEEAGGSEVNNAQAIEPPKPKRATCRHQPVLNCL